MAGLSHQAESRSVGRTIRHACIRAAFLHLMPGGPQRGFTISLRLVFPPHQNAVGIPLPEFGNDFWRGQQFHKVLSRPGGDFGGFANRLSPSIFLLSVNSPETEITYRGCVKNSHFPWGTKVPEACAQIVCGGEVLHLACIPWASICGGLANEQRYFVAAFLQVAGQQCSKPSSGKIGHAPHFIQRFKCGPGSDNTIHDIKIKAPGINENHFAPTALTGWDWQKMVLVSSLPLCG